MVELKDYIDDVEVGMGIGLYNREKYSCMSGIVTKKILMHDNDTHLLQEWYNSVGGNVNKNKLKEKGHHDFYYYFWKKGKNVGQKDFEKVAKILGHTYIANLRNVNE